MDNEFNIDPNDPSFQTAIRIAKRVGDGIWSSHYGNFVITEDGKVSKYEPIILEMSNSPDFINQ
jgi:hypothetical protein